MWYNFYSYSTQSLMDEEVQRGGKRGRGVWEDVQTRPNRLCVIDAPLGFNTDFDAFLLRVSTKDSDGVLLLISRPQMYRIAHEYEQEAHALRMNSTRMACPSQNSVQTERQMKMRAQA